MDEAIKSRKEQERHMHYLHRSVMGLQANIEHTQKVSETKVTNQLRDNQLLLQEINDLRHEVSVCSVSS